MRWAWEPAQSPPTEIPGDYFRFYEINPQVIAFSAGNHPFFTFLRDSHAQTDVVEGDARISLERERESGGFEGFDVLILDAFNGDAIPIHMLTREAFRLYLDRLRDANGIIAVHITNRMLDLAPVLAAIANEFELHGIEIDSPSMGDSVLESRWVLLSRSNPVLTTPYSDLNFKPLRSDRTELWTDQYSSLFGVLIR